MNSNIYTLGSGFIANQLPYPQLNFRLTPNSKQLEEDIFVKYQPSVLVNCIGRAGNPTVDSCENIKTMTTESNVVIPALLAKLCEKYHCRLIQLSSGCVFFNDGTIIYPATEETVANPKSFYSKTKYSCDLLLGQLPHVCSLRLRMPICGLQHPRNLISKLIKYQQVVEAPNSITYIPDLVRAIDWAIQQQKSGIYHITNPEPVLHSQILKEYQKYVPAHQFTSITETQLDQMTIAPRSNCTLDITKLTSEGFIMTPSEAAIAISMREFCSATANND